MSNVEIHDSWLYSLHFRAQANSLGANVRRSVAARVPMRHVAADCLLCRVLGCAIDASPCHGLLCVQYIGKHS